LAQPSRLGYPSFHMSVDVRAATTDDLDALAALRPFVHDLHVAARPDYFTPMTFDAARAAAARWFQQENAKVLLAVADGDAVGYLLAFLVARQEDMGVHGWRMLLVDQIAVRASQHRRGVGKALLDAAQDLARELGAQRIELEVWAFNERARDFFLSQGFAPMRHRLSQPLM
jgi:GNAT superfamily N-acetyltransferase